MSAEELRNGRNGLFLVHVSSRQKKKETTSKTINVGTPIDLTCIGLFRRHVSGGAHQEPLEQSRFRGLDRRPHKKIMNRGVVRKGRVRVRLSVRDGNLR